MTELNRRQPMNKWRPENPLKGVMVIDHSFEHGKYLGYEEGASAMLEAVIKEIEERFGDGHDRPILLSSPARWEAFKKEISHE
jgi:hypothetical protein